MSTFTVREELKPQNLHGISNDQIEEHWGLYKGYVTQSNTLKDELAALRKEGKGATALYLDRRRRYGFEYCGMVLHEYYFGNLKADVELDKTGGFAEAVAKDFGSFDAWLADFVETGKTRGIGWAVCMMDPLTGEISNHFIELHQTGNIPSFHPLVVMDVWEHAFLRDYKVSDKGVYINSFVKNINWDVVEERYADAENCTASFRFENE